jgi:hypothetical protein
MKTRYFAFICIGFAALATAGASLKSDIDALNKPIEAALMKRDVAAFSKVVKGYVTSDFKYSDFGGKPMDFDKMVAEMRQGLSAYSKITKSTSVVVSAKEHGSAGSAVEKQTMEGLTMGPDKKTHKMVYEGTSTETFRKVQGKWKMATMVVKTDKMTLDGKPISMGGG